MPYSSPDGWLKRIRQVVLDQGTVVARRDELEKERHVAIADLLDDNLFYPRKTEDDDGALFHGPYDLWLATPADGKLYMDVRADSDPDGTKLVLSMKTLRPIIKDYFMICESYDRAIQAGNHQQVEAIDMGRRGMHNEGSERLKEMLNNRIFLNFETARRLFTLVCVLHMR